MRNLILKEKTIEFRILTFIVKVCMEQSLDSIMLDLLVFTNKRQNPLCLTTNFQPHT
jgi:hypothetical protein